MEYMVKTFAEGGECHAENGIITFNASSDGKAFFGMEFDFGSFNDIYLMLPACIYDGNPMKAVERKYPPRYMLDETGVDCEPIMTNLPSLGKDKNGYFEVTAGDLATPCVAIYKKSSKEGFLLFTKQHVKGKNLGFSAKDGKIRITYPARRKERYKLCRPHPPAEDTGIDVSAGETVVSEYKLFTFPCGSILELFSEFFDKRKCLLSAPRPKCGYTKELWALMEEHFNTENFSGEYYGSSSKGWQPGWTGCGMSSYALMKDGGKTTRERAVMTVDYLTSHQSPAGFYYGKSADGKIIGDNGDIEGTENMHLVRRSADVLYFLFKHFEICGDAAKNEWKTSAKKCADAFCKLFERYGKLGQYVDLISGDMIVGTSACGAMVPGALARAYEYFGDEIYLNTAKNSADFLYENYLCNGYTNGGPGDILAAIDSESAFALLESLVVLYEVTKDEKYLSRAEQAAKFCSSWVVSYKYLFPEDSMFGKLGINTVGTVFANVQNKHSAPGICTLSGDSIYKLWKYTADDRYLELIKDIAHALPQCVATDERPIYSWDTPPRKLPAGHINERVNMSDWETVGSVFWDSCWCETSVILTFSELMKYPEMNE